ncbi:hypothetical protein V5O48_001014 [Marasmius crinis-equi]|uniref:Uncharacterized protein n=1 Tax=Marasmius crinis-equi TaxID=585013 RepID=A0ABR3FZP8_9AGAR
MSLKSTVQPPPPPPSLPSFASTFSSRSLSHLSSDDNSLPPIQTRSSVADFRRVKSPGAKLQSRQQANDDVSSSQLAGKKRARRDISGPPEVDERSDSGESSPGGANVKEEPEQDMLEPSPPPCSARIDPHNYDETSAPPPSSVLPSPLKKRRVTISGAPALDTDVRVPPDQSNSTPISPVVIGFTIQRDNPSAVEQVRSMISVKQQQQAIIEQRRGSVAGLVSPVVGNNTADLPPAASTKPPSTAARTRRSPNSGGNNRRHTNAPPPSQPAGNTRPPSPPTLTVSQPPVISGHPPPPPAAAVIPPGVNTHSLPPPPISFARRRANQLGGKKKPADIVISPREAHTKDQLALSIQSAPPIPQGGQPPGRFPMTLPRLPPVMAPGNSNINRPTGGRVPPTPTRFSAQRHTTANVAHTIPSIASTNQSLSVPSAVVPPTPHALHHPGYTGEKSAFLAPFEMFYDALNDSKQLKNWLSDQLQRSNTLMHSLSQQQEKLNETVDAMVERKVGGMRNELFSLRHRVEELEDALRAASRRPSIDGYNPGKIKGKQPSRNGMPMAPESYTFPPIQGASVERDRLRPEPERRVSSPGWANDRDSLPADPDRPSGSPAPYESRRLSISASRLDPPRPSVMEGRGSFRMSSPQQTTRDIPSNAGPSVATLPPHPSPSGNRPSRGRRPSINRHGSGSFRGGIPDRPASSPPRREERLRNESSGDVSMES